LRRKTATAISVRQPRPSQQVVGVSGTDKTAAAFAELMRRDVDIVDLIIRDAENQFAVILVDETTGDRIVLWDRDDRLRLRDRELPLEAWRSPRRARGRCGRRCGDPRGADGREAGAIVTSDIDHDAADRGARRERDPRDLRAARAGSSHRRKRHEAALRKLRKTHDNVLVVTMGDMARWRSTAIASTMSLHRARGGHHRRGRREQHAFIYALLEVSRSTGRCTPQTPPPP
jgi:hypothetical protein